VPHERSGESQRRCIPTSEAYHWLVSGTTLPFLSGPGWVFVEVRLSGPGVDWAERSLPLDVIAVLA
jgi:hypothetical protein